MQFVWTMSQNMPNAGCYIVFVSAINSIQSYDNLSFYHSMLIAFVVTSQGRFDIMIVLLATSGYARLYRFITYFI